MLRKTSLILCAAVVLVAALAPAAADSRSYFAQVTQTGDLGTNVWNRYYNPAYVPGSNPAISPAGVFACLPNQAQVGFDAASSSCQLKYRTLSAGGYKGYVDDIFNDTTLSGQPHIGLFDYEAASGTGQHVGYFSAMMKPVNATGDPNAGNFVVDCTGTAAATCLGSSNSSTSTGMTVPSPLGPLAPIGGFQAIPVPQVMGPISATGDIQLLWTAASSMGGIPISYDVWGLDKAACTPPTPSELDGGRLLGNFTGSSATVNVSAFGHQPGDAFCYYFAVKLVYPPASNGSIKVTSRFYSANSQGVAAGGTAAEVTNLTARISNRQKGVVVSWTTSLEESVRSFSIMRSTDGRNFSQVGQQNANNSPSSYVFLDQSAPIHGRTTISYKLVVNQASGATTSYGPVAATRGGRD